MKAFEVTLKGYYGGNDMTDDLILWVAAQSQEAIYLAVGGCSIKISDIHQLATVSTDDCEWSIPRDASEVAIAVSERGVIYRDKEIIAIDGDRVVIWNQKRGEAVSLSCGPEAIDRHRLSEREKQLLIKYEIDLDSLQGSQLSPWD
ncbi:hypothetical protein [Pseudomonas amygdali]|uniref:hypothetical protein n=1 Tax=Pseudomonas amygdali TaxID=47877 RepID=UPI000208CFB9|nr:hypothetical protein [Pseudomonas amygdali]